MKSFYKGGLTVLALAVVLHFEVNAQEINFTSVRNLGSYGTGVYTVSDVLTDSGGNMYTGGTHYRTVDFDLSATHNYVDHECDKFSPPNSTIAKYDSAGNLLETHTIGGYGNGFYIGAMAFDLNDNLVLACGFRDSAFMDVHNPQVPTYAGGTASNINGAALLVYDTSFNLINQKLFAIDKELAFNDLKIDAENNIILSGVFLGSFDIDPNPTEYIINSNDGTVDFKDLFVVKFDQDFNLLWAHSIGGNNTDEFGDLALDADGNIILAGTYSNAVLIDETVWIQGSYESFADDFGIISKFDADGNYVWGKVITEYTTSHFRPHSVVTDSSSDIYVTGTFAGEFIIEENLITLENNPAYHFFLLKLSPAGTAYWAKETSSTDSYNTGNSLSLGADGNLYFAGTFKGTMDADFGAATTNITSSPATSFNYFLSSYTDDGDLLWISSLPATGVPLIKTGLNSDIWMTGEFNGSVDFDPTAGVNTLSVPVATNFMTKYNAGGQYEMAGAFGGSLATRDAARALTVNTNGDVLVTGMMTGEFDFDTGPGEFMLSSTADSMSYVASFSSNGSFHWAFPLRGTLSVNAIQTDSQNNIYITGYFTSIVDFDPSPATYNLSSLAASADIFVAKYSPIGELIWAYKAGSSNVDHGYELVIDHDDNVIISGLISAGTVDFDLTSGGVYNVTAPGVIFFLAKYNSDATLIYAFSGVADKTYELACDAENNIYLTGYFSSFFNPGNSSPITYAAGFGNGNNNDNDYFLVKYNSAGEYQWMRAIGSIDDDKFMADLSIDTSGNVLWCGEFSQFGLTVDIDPTDGEDLLSAYAELLIKYTSNGDLVWGVDCGSITDGHIGVDVNGNVTMSARLFVETDIDPSEGEIMVENGSGYSLLQTRYSSEGTLESYLVYNSTGWVTPSDVEVTAGNTIYTVGFFIGNTNFNPTQLFAETIGNPSSGYDDLRKNGFLLTSQQEDFLYQLPPPDASFNAPVTSACENVCRNFVDNSAFGPTSWNWSFPGGSPSSSTDQNPQNICYSQAGQYDVQLISTNAFGSDTLILTNYITVLELPVISASGDAVICAGESIQIQAEGGITYAWSPAETLSDPGLNVTQATPLVTTTYTVVGTDANCSSSDEVVITVLELPVISLTADQSICIGDSIELNASGAEVFNWTPSASLSVNEGETTIATPEITTTYTVTGTSGQCSNTTFVTVTVNEYPIVDAGQDVSVCAGSTVLLQADGADSYSWTPSGTLINANTDSPGATPANTTTYTVEGTSNGCTSTDMVTVTVLSLPAIPVITLDNGILESTPANEYQWYFNGVAINGATNQTYTPTQTGSYSVEVTNGDNCSSSSQTVSFTPVIELTTGSHDFVIYPNPAEHALNLISGIQKSNTEILIRDAQGRLVLSLRMNVVVGNNAVDIDLDSLPSGLYSLEIYDELSVVTLKWIKMN